MAGLTLLSNQRSDVTLISNLFIDHYMCDANGEFVKVYLYLLRCIKKTPKDFSLLMIADCLNLTERDVLRALRYWEQKDLITVDVDRHGVVQSILLNEMNKTNTNNKVTYGSNKEPISTQVHKTTYVKEVSKTLDSQPSPNTTICRELGLIAEQYLKRPLNSNEIAKIMYFYDNLHFPADLIEYLFEHCVTIGNNSFRYIESVATSWADRNITTVKQAKEEGQQYRREYFAILKSFGIQNRTPIDLEVQYMKKWLDDYHFTTEVIREACQRTISKTGKPTFAYADTILKNWRDHGILAKRDIAALDNAHYAKKLSKQTDKDKPSTRQVARPAARFNNFEQREEYDFNQLEKQLNNT